MTHVTARSAKAVIASGVAAALVGAAIVLAITSGANATGRCDEGETTFKFKVPDGVTLKPTHGAVKRGPSKIKMSNCGGTFDQASGTGSIDLIGGVNFKYKKNRGPTGDYRIRFGGVGKLRARVVGSPSNIGKVQGGTVSHPTTDTTQISGAQLKLTSKGAKLLNRSVEAEDDGPFEDGSFASVSTLVEQ